MNVGSIHDTEEQQKKFIVSVPKSLIYYAQDHNIDITASIENFVHGGVDTLIISEDFEFEIEKSVDIGEMNGKMFKHIYIKEKDG